MFGLGTPEIILIVIAILVLFGSKKIPEFMQGIGKGIREFKKASSDVHEEINKSVNDSVKGDKEKSDKDNKST
jgi:sec-independent protein translocase protein TatA